MLSRSWHLIGHTFFELDCALYIALIDIYKECQCECVVGGSFGPKIGMMDRDSLIQF